MKTLLLEHATAVSAGAALGLVGISHCALMCGPLAAIQRVRRGRPVVTALGLSLGRLVSYTLLGALTAHYASAVLPRDASWTRWLRFALSAAVVLWLVSQAMRLWRERPTLVPAVRLRQGKLPDADLGRDAHTGSPSGRASAGVASALLGAIGLGSFVVVLPCAQLWAALSVSALQSTATHGALLMAGFALASLPGLVTVFLGSWWTRRLPGVRRVQLRRAASVLVAAVALLSFYRASSLLTPPSAVDEPVHACPMHASRAR